MLWLSRVKGLPKELSQDLCDFWLGHWHWQCFSFSLLITTMGESRQSAIGCNRKNMLTHSPQKPQSTNPSSPLSLSAPPLSLLYTDAIIDLICNCFMSGKIRVSICMTNSQCNLPIKLDGCPTVSLFLSFSLSPSPISLYHCLTVHHERILSNYNRSMSIIIIL